LGNKGEKAPWSQIREGPECLGELTISPAKRRKPVLLNQAKKCKMLVTESPT